MTTLELEPPMQPRGIDSMHDEVDYERQYIEAEARELIAGWEPARAPEVFRPERVDNARTALMEALTVSGHLSRVELQGDSLEAIHEQVLSRLLNGYDASLPTHEKWRRFNEICEELYVHRTHQRIVGGDLAETTSVAIISDYPTGLPDQEAMSLGYRPKNKKGMVRSTHLVQHADGSFTRVIEQVSRSNGTADSTFKLLADFGKEQDTSVQPDVAALKAPFTYDLLELQDGVVDLQRRLDAYSGTDVRYGERQHSKQLGYEELRQQSRAREQQVEHYTNQLADYEEKLDSLVTEGELTSGERDTLYKQKVLVLLRAICTLAPEYAADTFGAAAAQNYYQASNFELLGNREQRDYWLRRAELVEETVLFCGVAISKEKASELGVEVGDTGELVSEGKEKWAYKQGYCRVEGCEYRHKKTQVGPCQVCKKCEAKFSSGELK